MRHNDAHSGGVVFELVDVLRVVYGDDLTVHGHNEFAAKACPSFDVIDKWGPTFTRRVGA